MAWPNPLRRWTSESRNAWGFVFELTPFHPTPEEMEPMKHSYDTLGEHAYSRLKHIEASKKSCQQKRESPPPQSRKDLYVTLRNNFEDDKILNDFWKEVNRVPSWVDWDQIARGQDCFYRYGGPALTGLAFQSLLGGMVTSVSHDPRSSITDIAKGAARVVETLARTGSRSFAE